MKTKSNGIIEVLTGSDRPRKYWGDLKVKLQKEGSQVSEKIGQFKATNYIRTLIKHKADVNLRGGDLYETALHLAIEKDKLDVATLLIENGASTILLSRGDNAIHYAVLHNRQSIIRALAESPSADLNNKNNRGLTPLNMAIKLGRFDIAKELILLGADVNIADGNLMTPLHYAANIGNVDVLEELIKAGAKLDQKSSIKWAFLTVGGQLTPLHLAAQAGHLPVVEKLIENKATVYTKDRSGKTAIDLARDNNHLEIAQKLTDALDQNPEPHPSSKSSPHYATRLSGATTRSMVTPP
ncbi:MAG: ankyrin repeat domain-containing protein [Pseudomonadota bacterium]